MAVLRPSVVRRSAARRWGALVASVLAVIATVGLVGRVGDGLATAATPDAPSPRAVLAAALGSADVAHSGLVTSASATAVPQLPRLRQVGALLGGTTRTRVWWAGLGRWRVDTLSITGERGTYATGGQLVLWDYEDDELTTVTGDEGLRLPRPDDLQPPQAARRLLAGVGPADRLTLAGQSRIAGRVADTLVVTPGDPRGTIATVQVQVDSATGLPLAMTVTGLGGAPALDTRFDEVDLDPPPAAALAVPDPQTAQRRTRTAQDYLQRLDQSAVILLPDRLDGWRRSADLLAAAGDSDTGAQPAAGTATYGQGLVRFAVVPLPAGYARQVLDAARTGGAAPIAIPGGPATGRAVSVRSGVLAVVAALDGPGDNGYLLAGLVQPEVLAGAARDLLAGPVGDS